MKKGVKKSDGGFTLIEALIYSALLALFLGASILFASNVLGASGKVTERNEILANQEFVEKKLNWIVGQSNEILAPISGASGSILTLDGEDINLYPATFSVSNDKLMLNLSGNGNVPITTDRVKVSAFSVAHVSNQTSVPAIRVTLTLQSASSPSITSTINFSYVATQ
jgi:hypothetical protein